MKTTQGAVTVLIFPLLAEANSNGRSSAKTPLQQVTSDEKELMTYLRGNTFPQAVSNAIAQRKGQQELAVPEDCVDVNHQYDYPGKVTCDCVSPQDPCLTDMGDHGAHCIPDKSCVQEDEDVRADLYYCIFLQLRHCRISSLSHSISLCPTILSDKTLTESEKLWSYTCFGLNGCHASYAESNRLQKEACNAYHNLRPYEDWNYAAKEALWSYTCYGQNGCCNCGGASYAESNRLQREACNAFHS